MTTLYCSLLTYTTTSECLLCSIKPSKECSKLTIQVKIGLTQQRDTIVINSLAMCQYPDCNRVEIHTMSIYRYLLVLERKTRGRQLYLAKRFGPKRAFFSCRKRVQNKSTDWLIEQTTTCLYAQEPTNTYPDSSSSLDSIQQENFKIVPCKIEKSEVDPEHATNLL